MTAASPCGPSPRAASWPPSTPPTPGCAGWRQKIFSTLKNIWLQVPAHDDKCTIVKCHPLAEGVVASVGQDHLVKVSCDWLTLVSVLSCDWSDLVRGGHAAPGGGRAGGSRGPGVLAGLVTVRQVPRHLLQGRQDQVRRAISYFTLNYNTVCSGSTTPAPAPRRCGRAAM